MHLNEIVVEDVKSFLFDYYKLGLRKCFSSELFVVCAIYASVRLNEHPTFLWELFELSGFEKREFFKAYKHFVKSLNLKIPLHNPLTFISKICSRLYLSERTITACFNLLEKEKDLFNGCVEVSVGAIIYYCALVNQEKRTQREVAYFTGIIEPSIRHLFWKIVKRTGITFS